MEELENGNGKVRDKMVVRRMEKGRVRKAQV